MTEFNYYKWREGHRDFPCAFAKLLLDSLGPSAVLFREADAEDASRIAQQIDQITSDAVRTTARVLTVAVPNWDEPLMVASLAQLARHTGWSISRLKPFSYEGAERVPIGVHYDLRAGSERAHAVDTVPMVLAPWVKCPPSRLCPMPIFEMSIDHTCVGKIKDGKARADFLALPTPKMTAAQRAKQEQIVRDRSRTMNKGIPGHRLANMTAITSPDLATLLTA